MKAKYLAFFFRQIKKKSRVLVPTETRKKVLGGDLLPLVHRVHSSILTAKAKPMGNQQAFHPQRREVTGQAAAPRFGETAENRVTVTRVDTMSRNFPEEPGEPLLQ
jgi:hypothetical protein